MNYKYYILCWVSCISMVLADTMEDSSTSNVTSKTFAGLYGTKILDAIVTSATGFDLSLKDEAKNIYIFTKEDLQNKGYQSLEQALQYQPFITFVDSGFGNQLDLRGQGSDATRAVKILVNRVPINLLDTSHGVAPYNNIDIEDIESIEVIPGGGAVVYGNGTRGGVINIVTKKPNKDFYRGILKMTSGERFGLQGGQVALAAGKKVNDNLFVRADVSASYIPGTRNTVGTLATNNGTQAFSNDNNTNVYASFQTFYQINENQKLDFNINYSHLWTSYPRARLSLAQGRTGKYEPDSDTVRTQTDAMQTALNYTSKFSESLSFDALAFYQFSLLRYTYYRYEASGPLNMDGGGRSGFQNHGGGLNLKVRHETQKNTFIVGLDNVVEYSNRLNYTEHTLTLPVATWPYMSEVTNTATKLSNSIFFLDTWKPIQKFELGIGARIEYSNYWTNNDQIFQSGQCSSMIPNICNSFPSNLNESADFTYHTQRLSYAAELTPNFKYSDTGNVYVKAELGFISPSAYQMINADPNSSANTSNNLTQINYNEANGIAPEQYLTGEIGWKDEFDWSYVSATLFYTHTFNEIFVNNITHGTAYTYSNLGQTQRLGLEILARQSFGETDWLRLTESIAPLYTNVLQTNGVNDSLRGNIVPYVPWLKATLNIEVDIFKKNTTFLTLFLNNAYFSQTIALGGSGTATDYNAIALMNEKGYVLTDIGLNYGIKAFKLNVGVRNIFDSWYATYQKGDTYYPGMGRSYYAELRYSF